jgi:glutamyl-tRNA reductase
VPRQVKMIREVALKEVFAKDVSGLDEQGKLVLDKVLSYMEKKYNAVAIKTAKDVFLDHKIQRRKQD